MNENRNLLLAILLSAVVIFGWQYFVAAPQMKTEHAKQAQLAQQEKAQPRQAAAAGCGAGASSPLWVSGP